MSVLFLEHYLDCVETLPGELKKNFAQLQELNNKTAILLQTTEKLRKDLLYNISKLSKKEKQKRLAAINDIKIETLKIADDKISIANQTYELVDRHIQGLDSDLARFDLKKKEAANNPQKEQAKVTNSKKKKRKSSKLPKWKEEIDSTPNEIDPNAKPPNTEVLNMPIDPNEPRYCFCNQVSYGEMIGCENPDCVIEWFHFKCVNLEATPKGAWYCPGCKSGKNDP